MNGRAARADEKAASANKLLMRALDMQSSENLRRMLHDLRHGFPDERMTGFGPHVGPAQGYIPPVKDGEIWALIEGDFDAAIVEGLIQVTGGS